MFWLLLSIATNSLLLLILKAFSKFRINTLQGIVVNYAVAGSLGFIISGLPFPAKELIHQNWSWVPPIMGFLFITIFLLLAKTAQTIGVSVATIANKMSLVIPVLAAVILYGEKLTLLQILGLIMAMISVILSSLPKEKNKNSLAKHLLLPVLIFFGSGLIDALVNHARQLPISDAHLPVFISSCFAVAFFIGLVLVISRIISGKDKPEPRSLVAGILLGIPNFFSIYGITRALSSGVMKSSALYPVNNMGIVLFSAIGALLLFKEHFTRINWIGILLSLSAIGLIAFGK